MPEDVNIIDIARISGVSVSTVSRVLNKHPDVSPKTRQKVLDVIEKHSYIPNNSARNLKRESITAIGIMVKGFTNLFFTHMLNVIQSELTERHYLMLLQQVAPEQDEVDEAISLVKEKKPRGLIFLGGSFQQRREKLALLGVPYVTATITIHKNVDRAAFSSVTIDDYAEAYAVTDRICKAGHKRVAAIGFQATDMSISRLRIDGFRQALVDNGCYTGEECVAYAGEFSMTAGHRAARILLERDDFTCLFCISDMLALGAMRAIHEIGFSIPDDVSVVGFDGIEAGRYSIPSLATVAQPGTEMALESVRIILNRLHADSPHAHLIFPARFVEGESFKPL